ncbi:hypothetical protein [Lacticaseibacillus pantheris]|uniref:hypothetical protein n=1 Tax=Lacticaseibacillus pantheris TaxID=171523 RepID=UPI0026597FC9|nr:hypothetical protein [Lacticaseibacillus pantheris]WKF84688.1 hypothetical protein QY874_10445 [Lacticaseibacillus pantheris]
MKKSSAGQQVLQQMIVSKALEPHRSDRRGRLLLVPAHEDSVPKATRGFPIVRGL